MQQKISILSTVDEVWSLTDEISNVGSFFPFCALTKNQKNQNFEKMKNIAGHIISQMCTKNHNHMMYKSWDREQHEHNSLPFWDIFCPFTSLTTQKTKILKNWKKHQEISLFCSCVPKTTTISSFYNINYNDIMYGSWDMECNRQDFFVVLGHFLPFYPPYNPKIF